MYDVFPWRNRLVHLSDRVPNAGQRVRRGQQESRGEFCLPVGDDNPRSRLRGVFYALFFWGKPWHSPLSPNLWIETFVWLILQFRVLGGLSFEKKSYIFPFYLVFANVVSVQAISYDGLCGKIIENCRLDIIKW